MVYYGRPSRACGRCRLRRLKCDEGTPLCSACLRARVQSCEYRDALSLSFRDQTEKVVRKAQYREAASKSVALSARTSAGVRYSTSPYESLPCPTSQLARGYMYTNYLAESHHGGYLPCLVKLAQRSPNSGLPAAITAVGLAALANMHHCPQVMLEARQECTTAISLIKGALNRPATLKRDDVLGTVVMLSMFEVMTCSDAASIARWLGHVDGATRLIEVRGEDQLDRPEGLTLFTHLRAPISIAGIYREHYSSPTITHLTQKAKHYRSPQDPVDDVAAALLRLNAFCAALKDGTITTPSDIIRTALTLDEDLVAALLDAPATSSYSVIKVSVSEEHPERTIWGPEYHVYTSIAVSCMWNSYRSARILLRETIIHALRQMRSAYDADDQQHQALVRETREVCLRLVNDVCASVPFHLNAALQRRETPTFSTLDQKGSAAPRHGGGHLSPGSIGIGGAITLLWPLLIAANSGFASREQRQWIIHCLDTIWRATGVNQAQAMAQLLRDGVASRTWLKTVEDIKELGGQASMSDLV